MRGVVDFLACSRKEQEISFISQHFLLEEVVEQQIDEHNEEEQDQTNAEQCLLSDRPPSAA